MKTGDTLYRRGQLVAVVQGTCGAGCHVDYRWWQRDWHQWLGPEFRESNAIKRWRNDEERNRDSGTRQRGRGDEPEGGSRPEQGAGGRADPGRESDRILPEDRRQKLPDGRGVATHRAFR